MPIGSYALVAPIVAELVKKAPTKVLDAGIGFGFYGSAVRQWINSGVKPYATELIGIEGFPEYKSPCWDLYDRVFEKDIRGFGEFYLESPTFDFIIFSDVIEHFNKEEGVIILNKFIDSLKPNGVLMVGTPGVFCEQGAVYGNDLERHRSLWKAEDFRSLGFEIIKDGSPCEF